MKKSKTQRRTKSGQSISEYTSCIAYVCCLILIAFSIANGSMFAAISQSYSHVNSEVKNMNKLASRRP